MNEILEMTAEVLVYLPLLDKQRTADQDVERVIHKIHPDKDISEYKKELSAMLQVSRKLVSFLGCKAASEREAGFYPGVQGCKLVRGRLVSILGCKAGSAREAGFYPGVIRESYHASQSE